MNSYMLKVLKRNRPRISRDPLSYPWLGADQNEETKFLGSRRAALQLDSKAVCSVCNTCDCEPGPWRHRFTVSASCLLLKAGSWLELLQRKNWTLSLHRSEVCCFLNEMSVLLETLVLNGLSVQINPKRSAALSSKQTAHPEHGACEDPRKISAQFTSLTCKSLERCLAALIHFK